MKSAYAFYQSELERIRRQGLWKNEQPIQSRQGSSVEVENRGHLLNLCANNYLGLSSDPEVIEAARSSYAQWGFGLSSVRFICGTQTLHKELEAKISDFVGMEDSILYSSCFDANTGLFEVLLNKDDAVISDELNHASIIDGIRLCKAARYRYRNNDMADLRNKLAEAKDNGASKLLVATDGVFSMDGTMANLPAICDLADEYDALVMVDDSHAVGFIGEKGRGTPEYFKVSDRIDILTGTFGKALGGGSGGYTSSSRTIIDLLRQRSRPYLFSNSLAPAIAAASIHVLRKLKASTALRDRLQENTKFFRQALKECGFEIIPGEHPIVPIMIYDERETLRLADAMLEKGIYVTGFTYPVVPMGKARIRTQISAAHTHEQLAYAVKCFCSIRQADNR